MDLNPEKVKAIEASIRERTESWITEYMLGITSKPENYAEVEDSYDFVFDFEEFIQFKF